MTTLLSLAHLPIWVGWKREARNGRSTEVPYDPTTGRPASANNPATWATHDEAQNWAAMNGADGVGLMFSQLDDAMIGGIYLEGCRDLDTETIEPWAQAVIDGFSTYTETSPSQTGIRLLFAFARADLPAVEALFGGKYSRVFKRANGSDHPPAIEIQRGHGYLAITGEIVGATDAIRVVDVADLRWLIGDHGPIFSGPDASSGKTSQQGDDRSSGRALRIGVIIAATGASYEDMRDALLTYPNPEISDWARTTGMANGERELHRIYEKATGHNPGVRLDHFVAYMQSKGYIYVPTGDFWPADRVNARLPPVPKIDSDRQPVLDKKTGEQETIQPSAWLARHAPVEQITWAPGLPQYIDDRLVRDGGWIEHKGVTVLNLYRPQKPLQGDPTKAAPWIEHVRYVYPDDADHTIKWLAHRVRRPDQKINHCLLLIGPPGIGKDTLLEPVKHAIGAWNFREASPQQVIGRFNGFLKSVVLRVSEVTDMGESDRYKFQAHMKTILATPPDTLRVDEKNLREHDVCNVCGVILTTNEKTGVYLPADDRRHFVAWSEAKMSDFTEAYWVDRWRWYESGGFSHVAAYLAEVDLSDFNPKAPPRKTAAFWRIVDANRPPEDAELADALDELGRPAAVTLIQLIAKAQSGLEEWLQDRKNRRAIPHRLERCGYVPVRNDDADDGLFKIRKKRQVVYGRTDLSLRERHEAVVQLAKSLGSGQ
jgi:Family of unknown function (DUF5906)